MLFVLRVIAVNVVKALCFIPPFCFLWMLAWMTKHPLCQRLSWKKLPQAGEELGLQFKQARSYSKFGVLTGTIKGRPVEVEPDEDAKIRITLSAIRKLELNQTRPHNRPTAEMPDFKTSNGKFNWLFGIKRASPEIAGIFKLSDDLPDHFVRFYSRWMLRLRYIYVSSDYLRVSLNYGHPFHPYIPASVLPRFLNDVVDLAVQLDDKLG
jgi:hypothetical protein